MARLQKNSARDIDSPPPALPDSAAERCPSGRRYLIRNQVCLQGYRGFESLSLRYAESVDGPCGPTAECTKPGEVTERPKVHDWKSCVRATVPRVRIPPSPQRFTFRSRYFKPQRLWRCPRAAQSQAALSLRAMHWVPNACTEVSCLSLIHISEPTRRT